MKTLSLKIDISDLNLNPTEKDMSYQEIFSRVIVNSIMSYSQQSRGLLKEERNMIYTIDDSLKTAVKGKKDSIELDDKVFGFIKKCFRETKLEPNNLIRKVENNIDSVEKL